LVADAGGSTAPDAPWPPRRGDAKPGPPAVPGLELSGTSIYCNETGGDYYDYVLLPHGRIGVVVADDAHVPAAWRVLRQSRKRGANPSSRSRNIGFRLAAMPGVGRVLSKFTPKILIKKSLEGSYGNPERINDVLVDRYFDILLREGNREAMIDMFGSRRPAAHEKISTIRKPTLIIWGDQDRLIDVSNAYRFQRDIPGSQLLVIPGSGHVPMEESPREVLGAIREFLSAESFF
jgi:pimeloyl-ACP methyl ester carboxylesterase